MRLLGLALAVLCSSACARAVSSPRFERFKVPVSRFCTLTTIRDLRTDICFVTYDCGIGPRSGLNSLTIAPREVCLP